MNLNKMSRFEFELKKNHAFIDNFRKAVTFLFDSENILTPLYKDEIREVRYFKDVENSLYYIFEKTKDGFNVYQEDLFSFNKDKTDAENFRFAIRALKEKQEELYVFYKIFSLISKDKVIKDHEENSQKTKEIIEHIKNGDQDKKKYLPFLQDTLILDDDELNLRTSSFSCDIYTIIKLNQFFTRYANAEEYPYDFYFALSQLALEENKEYFKMWNVYTKYLRMICKIHHLNESNKFNFNDGENSVWMENDELFLKDQNSTFYFKIVDDDNYDVYLLKTECSRIEDELGLLNAYLKEPTEKNIDNFRFLMLSVKDGKMVYMNEKSYGYSFNLDIGVTTGALVLKFKE